MKSTATRYINASDDAVAELAKMFDCSTKMVYYALTYRKDTLLARKIRFMAVQKFNAIPMLHVPECETLHVISEDKSEIMRQTFANGAVLEADKATGTVKLIDRHGKTVHRWEDVSLQTLSKIQVCAENL